MFEFKTRYREPGYHKPGDPPFIFPPKDMDSKIDANLIEVEGRNGTGKTTLLNCMALALGYLDRATEDQLEAKPMLRRKLQDLEKNETLEYYFRIICDKPEHTELVIEREEGKKPKWWLNSKQVDPDTINRRFDLVFLTEDDPKKVVDASLGKLARYFKTLEKGLVSLSSTLTKNVMDINDFHDFKNKEKRMLNDIQSLERRIKKNKKDLIGLRDKLKKLDLKIDIKNRLELIGNEQSITSTYNRLRKKYDELKGKKGTRLVRRLYRWRQKLKRCSRKLKEHNARIIQICKSLEHYGISIQSKKLIEGDYTELNRLNKEIQPRKRKETIKLRMIEEMTELFGHYLKSDIVPLINKPVSDVLAELNKMKLKFLSDRIFALVTQLNKVMDQKKKVVAGCNKAQEKVDLLFQKAKEVEDFDNIHDSFVEAEKKYLDLQLAMEEGRTKLLSQWKQLGSVGGDPATIRDQVQQLKVDIGADETMKNRLEDKLKLLRENAAKPPKHEKESEELQELFEKITHTRENISQWITILQDPTSAREQFESAGEGQGFGMTDYQNFVRTVGEYLGNQFEPVSFDYKLHNIKFFDIEKDTFTTKDDRQIPIDKLSRGQSKIATLMGSFKKMDSSKRKIVLIDEIADLDPENLKKVKATLKKKFAEGSLLLAVLVRPPRESSTKIVDVKGWG